MYCLRIVDIGFFHRWLCEYKSSCCFILCESFQSSHSESESDEFTPLISIKKTLSFDSSFLVLIPNERIFIWKPIQLNICPRISQTWHELYGACNQPGPVANLRNVCSIHAACPLPRSIHFIQSMNALPHHGAVENKKNTLMLYVLRWSE